MVETAKDGTADQELGVCALHRCAEGGYRPGRVRLEVVTGGGAVRGGVGRLGAFGHELDLLRVVSTLRDAEAASGLHDPPARVGVVLEALRDRTALSLFEADPRERRLQWMLRASSPTAGTHARACDSSLTLNRSCSA